MDGVGSGSRDLQTLVHVRYEKKCMGYYVYLYMIHSESNKISGSGDEYGIVSVVRGQEHGTRIAA